MWNLQKESKKIDTAQWIASPVVMPAKWRWSGGEEERERPWDSGGRL